MTLNLRSRLGLAVAFVTAASAAGASAQLQGGVSLNDVEASLQSAGFAPAAARVGAAPRVPNPVPVAPPRRASRQPAKPGRPSQPPSAGTTGPNGRVRPDFAFTPGRLCTAQDPDFKEYRYAEHIPYCARNVTPQMKQEVAAHYGVPQSEWANYEFDHLIPLAIGGDSHADNVWPQPRGTNGGSDEKDRLENELYLQMKAGTITQAQAVQQIYAWFGATNVKPTTVPHN